jgi:Mg-chelatase subunit ChlD
VDEGLKPRTRNRSDVEFDKVLGRKLLDVVFCTTAANVGDGSKSLANMDHALQTATRSKRIKYSDILRQKGCDKDTELIVVAVDNFGRMQKRERAQVISLITPQTNHTRMAKAVIRERSNRLQITIFDALAIVDIHTYRTLDNK